ncbi:hypothetical protein D3C87_1412210 [compost metagenome]
MRFAGNRLGFPGIDGRRGPGFGGRNRYRFEFGREFPDQFGGLGRNIIDNDFSGRSGLADFSRFDA